MGELGRQPYLSLETEVMAEFFKRMELSLHRSRDCSSGDENNIFGLRWKTSRR
jgi:hypothetical protein